MLTHVPTITFTVFRGQIQSCYEAVVVEQAEEQPLCQRATCLPEAERISTFKPPRDNL